MRSSFDTYSRPESAVYLNLPVATKAPLDEFIALDQSFNTPAQKYSFIKSLNNQYRTMREFARDEINGECYTAVVLGRIYDQAHDRTGKVVRPELQRILTKYVKNTQFDQDPNIDQLKRLYLVGLMRDRTEIDKLRRQTTEAVKPSDTITDDDWLSPAPLARADRLFEAAQSVNIESLLIASVESLERLNTNCDKSEATLRELVFTEQILEPMAEMIGFDGLAMALSSRSKEIRLLNAGRQDLLDRADEMLSVINEFNDGDSVQHCTELATEEIVANVFGLPHGFKAMPSIETTGSSRAIFGTIVDLYHESRVTPDENGTIGRFRLKSRGSLAWKLLRAERKNKTNPLDKMAAPVDLLGITIITKDEREQRETFTRLVSGMYHSNSISPVTSNSKISPIHVAGTEDFIDGLLAEMSQRSDLRQDNKAIDPVVDAKPAETDDGLQLAKVTFHYGRIPTEIQVVTADKRKAMRCGNLAHVIYKARTDGGASVDVDRLAAILPKIHSRRKHISLPLLVGSELLSNGQHSVGDNERRAKQLLDAIDQPAFQNATLGKVAVLNSEPDLSE